MLVRAGKTKVSVAHTKRKIHAIVMSEVLDASQKLVCIGWWLCLVITKANTIFYPILHRLRKDISQSTFESGLYSVAFFACVVSFKTQTQSLIKTQAKSVLRYTCLDRVLGEDLLAHLNAAFIIVFISLYISNKSVVVVPNFPFLKKLPFFENLM